MTQSATLEELLDQMTLALQQGALDQLAPLAEAINREIARLPVLDRARAEGLRRRALRNETCLQAAARGVRAAIVRVAGIGGQAPQLSTYSADGRLQRLGASAALHSSRL